MPRSTKIIGSGVYTDELRRVYTLVTKNKTLTPEQKEDIAILYRNAKQSLLNLGETKLVMLKTRSSEMNMYVPLSDIEVAWLLRNLVRNRDPRHPRFTHMMTTPSGQEYGLIDSRYNIERLKEIEVERRKKRDVTLKFEDDLRLYLGGPRIIKRPDDPDDPAETVLLTDIKTGDSMTDINREYFSDKYHSTSDVHGSTKQHINSRLILRQPIPIPKSMATMLPITREDRYVAVLEGDEPPNLKPTSKEGFISKIRARLFGPRQPPPIVENMTTNPLVQGTAPELDQVELIAEQIRRRPEYLLTNDELNTIMSTVQFE
jgi:hypothetical protein